MTKAKKKQIPLLAKLGVGAMAGAIGTTAIYPVDMVKTRMMSANAANLYKNPMDCAQKILKQEGSRGFYKGLNANLLGVLPEKAIKLTANEVFREFLEEEDGSIGIPREMLAAAGAGLFQVVATNPMEVMKIRLQMQALKPAAERQTTQQLLAHLGVRGLYMGTPATLMRDVPFSMILFPTYANVRRLLSDENGHCGMGTNLFAGALSAMGAAGLVTPLDVVKTRLQVSGAKAKYGGSIAKAYKMTWAEGGMKVMFAGCVPRMLVVGPLFGITFLAFEAQKEHMLGRAG